MAEVTLVDAMEERAVESHIGQMAEKAGSVDILFNAIGMQDVQEKPRNVA